MSDAYDQLNEIERAIDEGTYRPGPWKRLVNQIREQDQAQREAISEDVSRVSRKLHLRNEPKTFSVVKALSTEVLGAIAGFAVLALGTSLESPVLVAIGASFLVVTLQPLLKVSIGQLLGVEYEYAYLMMGEPRFKMVYGRYLSLDRWRRVATHFSGAFGSPIGALLGGVIAAQATPATATFLWYAGLLHLSFGMSLFAIVYSGIDTQWMPGHLRSGSAAVAAEELLVSQRN